MLEAIVLSIERVDRHKSWCPEPPSRVRRSSPHRDSILGGLSPWPLEPYACISFSLFAKIMGKTQNLPNWAIVRKKWDHAYEEIKEYLTHSRYSLSLKFLHKGKQAQMIKGLVQSHIAIWKSSDLGSERMVETLILKQFLSPYQIKEENVLLMINIPTVPTRCQKHSKCFTFTFHSTSHQSKHR